jgi:hypothetical protein
VFPPGVGLGLGMARLACRAMHMYTVQGPNQETSGSCVIPHTSLPSILNSDGNLCAETHSTKSETHSSEVRSLALIQLNDLTRLVICLPANIQLAIHFPLDAQLTPSQSGYPLFRSLRVVDGRGNVLVQQRRSSTKRLGIGLPSNRWMWGKIWRNRSLGSDG